MPFIPIRARFIPGHPFEQARVAQTRQRSTQYEDEKEKLIRSLRERIDFQREERGISYVKALERIKGVVGREIRDLVELSKEEMERVIEEIGL